MAAASAAVHVANNMVNKKKIDLVLDELDTMDLARLEAKLEAEEESEEFEELLAEHGDDKPVDEQLLFQYLNH